MKKIQQYIYVISVIALISCNKYLDVKPDKTMVIPTTLTDLQALLNNAGYMNRSEEAMPEMSADNYYLSDDAFNALSEISRKNYLWDEDQLGGAGWSLYYKSVLYANQVLETLSDIEGAEDQKEILKGKALFFRANAYYQLAQNFTEPYQKENASQKLGLPLRLSPGISEPSVRASLQETYDRILQDFTDATKLLPNGLNEITTQPNKAAAYFGLARTYLLMGEYEKALNFSDSSLRIYNSLINYNDLDVEAANPISLFNEEIIYFSQYNTAILLRNNTCNVDTNLYELYSENDLRKRALFDMRKDGTIRFKGNYAGDDSQGIFNGMTTAEMLLIKAECQLRLGGLKDGENTLNKLLINRFENGKFQPVIFRDMQEGIRQIIEERRKELLFRGSRWTDLRRFNLEKDFQRTIYRNIGAKTYELHPNDKRYVFRIPEDVIVATGMQQNDR